MIAAAATATAAAATKAQSSEAALSLWHIGTWGNQWCGQARWVEAADSCRPSKDEAEHRFQSG
jgi:hypothetical protein